MAGRPSLLLVKTGDADPLDVLFDTLRADEEIEFAADAPVTPSEAKWLIRTREDIAVVLIIGREVQVPPVVRELRALSDTVHIVTLWIEEGTAQLTLRDSSFSELNLFIHSLVQSAASRSRRGGGITRNYRARFPSAPPAEPPSRSNLPVAVQDESAPEIVEVLVLGLKWVEAATRRLMEMSSTKPQEPAGFALSWEGLDRWLQAFVAIGASRSAPAEDAFARLIETLQSTAQQVPLARIWTLLQREDLALKLFLITVAGELDIRFHRLFGALHDDLGRRHPSVGLACAIVSAATDKATPVDIRRQLAALAQLRDAGLIEQLAPVVPAADEPLRPEPQLVDWLLTGQDSILVARDPLGLVAETPVEALELLPASRRRANRLAERGAIQAQGGYDKVKAILLSGSPRGWIEIDAAALAGRELRIRGTAAAAGPEALTASLRSLMVGANLSDRRMVVELSGDEAADEALWRALATILPAFKAPPFVVGANPAQLLALVEAPAGALVVLTPPSADDRRLAIATVLEAAGEQDPELAATLAGRYPISLAAIPGAAALARASAVERGRPEGPLAEDWLTGFRRAAGARIPRLARRLEPWTDTPRDKPEDGEDVSLFPCLDRVVLPAGPRDQLRSIIKHVRFGPVVLEEWGFGALLDSRGVAALFSGDSGTGKTMAAHAVASELAVDLYAIDLARIVSKYIGETEKNLDAIFGEAADSGAVLLFDEADALFGRRSAVGDAHDRYANIEVAYLLQRMQDFPGLAILTSNHPENIDTAFTRRLRFKIDFPRPSAASRARIWDQSIPLERRSETLDFRALAGSIDVTGGSIRQMAMHAAVLAVEEGSGIRMSHVIAGTRAVLVRLGSLGDLAKLEAIAGQDVREAA